MLNYHLTVTSSLQAVVRLVRLAPYVVVIEVPLEKAQAVAERQAIRYPSIVQSHVTRTALRHMGLPVVQMVIMAPHQAPIRSRIKQPRKLMPVRPARPRPMMVSIILLSTVILAESREVWRDAFDVEKPLTWRNYALSRTPAKRITWRLSVDARKQYRTRIARLITGGGGVIHPRVKPKKLVGKPIERPKQESGEKRRETPRRLSPEAARRQILNLAAHMQHYPGLSGIRSDVFDLAQYCTRVWKSTHPDSAFPLWPKMPILPYLQPRTAPLATITQETIQEAPEHAIQNQSEEVR